MMIDGGIDSSNLNQDHSQLIDPSSSQQAHHTFTRHAASVQSKMSGPARLKWYKCVERGPVPQGRDSHSSAMINNKIYIFGGQGDGDIIFDDLYSVEIIEEVDAKGDGTYVS